MRLSRLRVGLFSIVFVTVFFAYAYVHAPDDHDKQKHDVVNKRFDVLFVGDVMLGRHVDVLMSAYGKDYPFRFSADTIAKHDYVLVNFEGTVPEKHIPAPPMTFQFSVRDEYVQELGRVGVDILSLANNHSMDYGEESMRNTKARCIEYGLVCKGDPTSYNDESITIVEKDGTKIGVLFLHTTWKKFDRDKVRSLIETMTNSSDVQVAYIHWGNEYEELHSSQQEEDAQALIDDGIDVVIGHHPHVIQDVEIYNDKPIFYSLGNFIFDQYFSNEVQEGLGISMSISSDEIVYTLVPFTSKESRSQPRPMDDEDAKRVYRDLFASLQHSTLVDIESGAVRIPR